MGAPTLVMCMLCFAAAQAAPSPSLPLQSAEYRIGVDDALIISVLQAPELDASVRVSTSGEISMPLLGVVPAAGLTTHELKRRIETRLREKYVRDPDVTVQVSEIRSQSVSVVGAVRRPGTVQVRGATTLLEVLSLAGGLAEDAGERVVVLRAADRASAPAGEPAAPSAAGGVPPATADAGRSPIEIGLKDLMESRDARLNIPVRPGDVVSVQAASVVYVVGAFNRPGAFAMRGNEGLTVLRALALGEGLASTAAKGDALVVRTNDRGERIEIAVDLGAILAGKDPDVPLEAQDVLFVPNSSGKVIARATLDTLVRIVSLRAF